MRRVIGHFTYITPTTKERGVRMNTMLSKTTEGATTRTFTRHSCMRCNGHMEHEMCIDLESDSGCCTFWVLRCLQCGDIVDETILRNRSLLNPGSLFVAAA
jgi:RNase P subunit RPR2